MSLNISSALGVGLQLASSGPKRVQIIQNNNTIVSFDASLKEKHSRTSKATRFPVEDGTSVSDHVILEPFDLEMTGIISDTPIKNPAALLTEAVSAVASALLPPVGLVAASIVGQALLSAVGGSKSPSVSAYLQLLQLQESRQPFTVITTLQRYVNMWIEELSVPRTAQQGNCIEFDLKLVQLTLVTPQSVNISIFSNPALSAAQADVGEQGLNLSKRYQQGFATGSAAVGVASPGGISGGS